MNRRKTTYGIISFLAGILMLSSCENNWPTEGMKQTEGNMVYFGISVPVTQDIVVTRAEATELEKNIYTIRLMAFDSNGNCFYNEQVYNNSTVPYQTSQALGIMTREGSEYEQCTIWVIANVGNWGGASGSYDFDQVTTLDELKATYGYRILQSSGNGLAPRNYLPMTGTPENTVDMTQANSVSTPITIQMQRAVAKVSFTIDVPNDNLEFYFNDWTVESLPRYSYVMPQGNTDYADANSIAPGPYGFYYPAPNNQQETSLTTVGVGQWLTDIENQNYGFYTYENRCGGRLADPNSENLQGDTGDYAEYILRLTDTSGNDPKFKTLYAPQNASFIIITGLIREKDTQNVTSFAYKIALGANNTNDYNIERNHHYVYKIHINGINYDDITVETFDSRVHKAYALQINTPYNTQMDAHYDKRYLNILASPGKVDLQLYANMEDAEAGTNPITTENWIVLSEMDTYNIDIDPNESTSKELEYTDTENKQVYIYTQENLTTSPRSVVLKVTHTPKSGSSEIVQEPVSRYYTYTQAGVIEMNGLYVESYEEYGMELNPYDSESPVTGLQWGWSNRAINAYNTNTGQNNTATIINTVGNPGNFEEGSLYRDYAARYCHNKNKRDGYGNVIEANWYLPAIEELLPLTNSIMATSASWTPITMAGKEYWSSSVPTENDVNTNPFQERLDNATPWDWWFWQLIYNAWEWLFRDRVENPDSEYYYTKVAKAAKDGAEALDTQGEEEGYNLSTYYKRIEIKHVRAVRVKP